MENTFSFDEFDAQAKQEIALASEEAKHLANQDSLNEFKGRYLGKKSFLTKAFALMKDVPAEQKKQFGQTLSALKNTLNSLYTDALDALAKQELAKKLESERVDITLPGYHKTIGAKSPFYAVIDDITDFFVGLGYIVDEGPEVETDRNNFELLNIPKDHPARDMQDTFVIDAVNLLRSQTSDAQARAMLASGGKGPIKMICPGKVYRRDNDATHSHQFGQCEGLVLSEDVTFANLLATLTMLLKHLFGAKREVRFRPSFFPFTEPSIEADISCFECHGKGCDLCKHTGWIEVLGAGMVHPNVLRLNGFDEKRFRAFAFGIGIDRIAMLKYGIDDIKRFYTDDVSFIEQFRKE